MDRRNVERTKRDEREWAALAAAAILSDPVELPMLGALGVTTAALEALFDSGRLQAVSASTARLAENIDRGEVTGRLAWSELRRLHERAAELLSGDPGRVGEAARHYRAACRYAEARALMVREAESHCNAKRYDQALAIIDEALAIWPASEDPGGRLGLLGEMVRCARNCGRREVARRALEQILEMVSGHDPAAAVETHQQLADVAMMDEDFSAARRHLESAATLAETGGTPEEAAQRWFSLASFLADQTRPRDAQRALARAAELAGDGCDPALRSELLGFEGLLQAMQGQAAAARERVEQSLAVAIEHRLTRQAALAYRRMANIREYGSDYAGEREAHLHAIALCRKSDAADSEQSCLTCLAYVFFRTGEWKRALATARDVAAQPDAHPALRAGAVGVQAMIAAFRGEQRRTRARLEEARIGLRRFGVLSLEFHLLWAEAFAREVAGDSAGAAAAFNRLLDLWTDTDDCHDVLPGAMCAAAFFGDAGDERQLARITDITHAIVAMNDNDESRAARLAVMGEVSAGGGDWAVSATHLGGARDGYDRLGTPIEQALVRRRLARVLVAAGREREAAEEREACAAIARRLGMRPLLTSLTAAPATPRERNPAAVVTARQRDVLKLLAAGLTNKEAADRLHLSPRTVEMHVAGLLERLDCRTRTEAIRRAGELGLLG